jgi:hypothetical protein
MVHIKFNNVSVGETIFPFETNEGEELTIESQLLIPVNC